MNLSALARSAGRAGGLATLIASALLVACGGDDDATANASPPPSITAAPAQLTVTDQRARPTINDTTGVYFTVKNNGPADRLLSVKADPEIAGMAQVHETVAEGATMKMQEARTGVEVPANGTLELKPGGYHVMLMNLKRQLSAGDSLRLDVVFEKAGTISLVVPVQDIGAAGSSAGGTPSSSSTSGGMPRPQGTTTMGAR